MGDVVKFPNSRERRKRRYQKLRENKSNNHMDLPYNYGDRYYPATPGKHSDYTDPEATWATLKLIGVLLLFFIIVLVAF